MILYYKAGDPASHKEIGRKLQDLQPGEYVIDIKKNRPIRSLAANRYYFGVVLKIIVMETQQEEDVNQMHEFFKMRLNAQMIEFKNGKREMIPGSTSVMDSKEFTSFVQRVKDYARTELNLVIPEPGDVDRNIWSQINEQYSKRFDGI